MTTTIAGPQFRPLTIPASMDAGDAADFREFTRVRNLVYREIAGNDDDAMTPEELLPHYQPDPNEMADSSGGRNEFCELLRWCQIAERFAWSSVERVLDRGQLSAGDDAQIGALRQVLA